MFFQTYASAPSTDTRSMLVRSCVGNLSNTGIATVTTLSSFSQVKLSTMMNNYTKVKLNERELNTIKSIVYS